MKGNTAPEAEAMFVAAGFVCWQVQIVSPDGTVDAVDYWDAPDVAPHRLVSNLRPMAQLAVTAVKERLMLEDRIAYAGSDVPDVPDEERVKPKPPLGARRGLE